MPDPRLDKLRGMMSSDLAEIAADAAAGRLTPSGFETLLAETIDYYTVAALKLSAGENDLLKLPRGALVDLDRIQEFHVGKAEQFAAQWEREGEWRLAWGHRTALYSGSTAQAYGAGQGVVDGAYIKLPAQPGEGSPCMQNCKCSWRRETVDAQIAAYDFFWELGQAEHCDECRRRAGDWNPLQVVYGEVV